MHLPPIAADVFDALVGELRAQAREARKRLERGRLADLAALDSWTTHALSVAEHQLQGVRSPKLSETGAGVEGRLASVVEQIAAACRQRIEDDANTRCRLRFRAYAAALEEAERSFILGVRALVPGGAPMKLQRRLRWPRIDLGHRTAAPSDLPKVLTSREPRASELEPVRAALRQQVESAYEMVMRRGAARMRRVEAAVASAE